MSADGFVVVEVDPRQQRAWTAWHAAWTAAHRAETGAAAGVLTAPELAVTITAGSGRHAVSAWAGLVGDELVTTGLLRVPELDNLDSAEVVVATPPAHRRRGHGAAMLVRLEQRCRALGRTRLESETCWAHEHGADPVGTPGFDFAVRHGFDLGLGDVQRELRGPVPAERLDELATSAGERHGAYELRSWSGPVPEDLVEGWLALDNVLLLEAPSGTMQREASAVDVAAHRAFEATLVRQGRRAFHTVALDPAGEVVAYTLVVTTLHEPDRAYQWGTLVHPRHRGHRLGLAVKVANHRLLQQLAPVVVLVRTWNAEENRHMIAVNEALGFVPTARLGELHKPLT